MTYLFYAAALGKFAYPLKQANGQKINRKKFPVGAVMKFFYFKYLPRQGIINRKAVFYFSDFLSEYFFLYILYFSTKSFSSSFLT